ncbi:MAG: hypothetical protein F2813_04910 [Actinobacteria bacterium]|uniref:Unannotated protein n=1 Tax=freshwater metagenome TaxID=449393 RepID=A0A6J5ZUC3_9ZZZZ|nr:hypothetical protein [Actinomycetota bacterium]
MGRKRVTGLQRQLRPQPIDRRSIVCLRRTLLICVASALAALATGGAAGAVASPILILEPSGRVTLRDDPLIPPADRSELPPSLGRSVGATMAAAPKAETASSSDLAAAVARLADSGAIDAATSSTYRSAISSAKSAARRLSGRRRSELRAVIANFNRMSRGGLVTASRLAPMIETLKRNVQWWTSGSLLSYGQRVGFKGSEIVWQSYPGQGLQIQWLGTFGHMNALWTVKSQARELGDLADEVDRLSVKRAGGVAWEYLFQFGGGRPPWVSGLSQGTAVQALARASERLDRPHLLNVARDGLGVFRTRPPSGVRLKTAHGYYYAAYSYAPGQRIYNAFYQSLIGLHDLSAISGDKISRGLWLAGQREGRYELPHSDTGSWSYYQPGELSPMNYHIVLRDFIRGLCDRMTADRQRETIKLRARKGPAAVLGDFKSWPDGGPYCVMTTRFSKYLYKRVGTSPPSPAPR